MQNFNQLDPNSLSLLLNPQAVGAAPGIGGLSQVPGMGQVPGMEMQGAPTQAGADARANYANSAAMPQGGGNDMAAILGMEALKGIQSGAANANRAGGLSSPAPMARGGDQVRTTVTDQSNQIDPRLFLMMQGPGAK